MEPMALGSPPSSPSSPSANPNFLPNFLMGEPQQQTATPNTSPGRHRNNSGTYGRVSSVNTPETRNLRQKLFQQSAMETPTTSTLVPLSEKAGPPKQGLFDTIDNKKKGATPMLNSTGGTYGENVIFNESFPRVDDLSRNVSFYEGGRSFNHTINKLDRIDTNWVTVFGFPPSALSLVLAQLSNCGNIIEKKLPAQGNWMHIKFNNVNEVSRALALNGKCITNSVMIGVSLHYNKENKENDNVYTSPIRSRPRQSLNTMSPWNASNSVIAPQNVPQKSTGLVTRAMEYVFGW